MATGRYEYVNFANYLFLTFLRIWAGVAARFFFRRMQVVNKENIPLEGPIIFAVNHQSAFMDPVLIGITSGRKPWYLTRASVFRGKFVRFLLNAIHMLPVYRLRDQVDIKQANLITFEKCRAILQGGGSILIFPEGNHGMLKRLRVPLKKGIARIALDAEAAADFQLGLKIVPVGLTYEHPTKFRSRVLISYGEPFRIDNLEKAYDQSPSASLNTFCRQLEDALRPLIIDIPENYDFIERQWMNCRTRIKEPWKQFEEDKVLIDNLIKTGECRNSDKPQARQPSLLLKIIGFPVFLIGCLLNLPSYLLTRFVLKKTVIDPHFNQSIMLVCGMVIVPVLTILESILLNVLTGYFWMWLVIIPLSGILSYDYYDLFIRVYRYVPGRTLAKGFLPH